MQQEEKRLRYYERVIGRDPRLKAAIRRYREERPQLPQDELLYLCSFAPSVLAFAQWVLSQALASGKKRLYFLARDAYPVYLAARRMCAAGALSVDCRYLHVSRFSLRMAEYGLMGPACTERLCVGGIRVTLRKILARGGVEDLAFALAEELGMSGEEDRVLNYSEILTLRTRLQESEHFLTAVSERSRRIFPDVLRYLEQEGLLEDIPWALVDSGWIGTLQQTMERLLHSHCPDLRLEGYYFGLYEIPAEMRRDAYRCFFFSPVSGLRRKVFFSNCLFETLCSAPEGMTLRYEATEDGRMEPVLWGEGLNREHMARYCALIDRLAELYGAEAGASAPSVQIEKLLGTLMARPGTWEAQCFGELCFCDDVLENTVQQIAEPLNRREIRQLRFWNRALTLLGIRKGTLRESAWPEGSLARSSDSTFPDIAGIRLYKLLVYLRKTWKTARR